MRPGPRGGRGDARQLLCTGWEAGGGVQPGARVSRQGAQRRNESRKPVRLLEEEWGTNGEEGGACAHVARTSLPLLSLSQTRSPPPPAQHLSLSPLHSIPRTPTLSLPQCHLVCALGLCAPWLDTESPARLWELPPPTLASPSQLSLQSFPDTLLSVSSEPLFLLIPEDAGSFPQAFESPAFPRHCA